MKRLLILLLALTLVLPVVGFAQTSTQPANPNANIIWPPPVYVIRGQFPIRGTANLPNMTNYFIEFRPLNDDLTPQGGADVWFPAILPSQAAVQNDVLGVWDTTLIADGLYEMRLTVNVSQGSPVFAVVSPLRIENTPPPFAVTPTPFPTATFVPPTPTLQPTVDTTPRVTITSSPAGNVRQGDGTNYNIITSLPTGTSRAHPRHQQSGIGLVSGAVGQWSDRLGRAEHRQHVRRPDRAAAHPAAAPAAADRDALPDGDSGNARSSVAGEPGRRYCRA